MSHRVETTQCPSHDGCHLVQAELGTGPLEAHVRYEVHPCTEHADCVRIDTIQRGVLIDLDPVTFADIEVKHESHKHASIHAECRLNDAYPSAIDHRSGTPQVLAHQPRCQDCSDNWHNPSQV